MPSMLDTIVPKSDQLNADDLIGRDLTIKITGVAIKGGQEQPVSISFEGDNGKPYKPCKGMCRLMVSVWGADSAKYVGHSMTLYRDPTVKWAGLAVGGIRISHMSHLDNEMTMAITITRSNKKPHTVKPLMAGAPVPESSGAAMVATPDAPADLITPDEALAIEARCTENAIKIPVVKKHFGIERFAQMTPQQLVEANQLIDETLKFRRETAAFWTDRKKADVPPLEP